MPRHVEKWIADDGTEFGRESEAVRWELAGKFRTLLTENGVFFANELPDRSKAAAIIDALMTDKGRDFIDSALDFDNARRKGEIFNRIINNSTRREK